jgi:hypothetical protein
MRIAETGLTVCLPLAMAQAVRRAASQKAQTVSTHLRTLVIADLESNGDVSWRDRASNQSSSDRAAKRGAAEQARAKV